MPFILLSSKTGDYVSWTEQDTLDAEEFLDLQSGALKLCD